MTAAPQPLKVPAARTNLLALAAGSALLVVGGCWVAGWIGSGPSITGSLPWLGVLGVVFFGGALLYLLYRIVVPQPMLLIDANGIEDHASAVGAGAIQWTQVADLSLARLGPSQVLAVGIRDEDAFLATRNPAIRNALKAQKAMTGHLVNIPLTAAAVPAEEVLARANAFRAGR